MPATITGTRAATAIQAPLNGEAGDAGTLITTTIQTIANNIAELRGRMRFGTISEMIAATGVNQDDIWITEQGVYVADYVAIALNAPWEFAGTGATVTWRNTAISLLLGSSGLARIGPITGIDTATPNGKVPVSQQTNPLIYASSIATDIFLESVAAASEVSSTNLSQYPNLHAGDMLTGSIGPIWARSWANTYAYATIEFVDGFGTTSEAIVERYSLRCVPVASYFDHVATIPFYHEVQVSGTTRIRLKLTAGNSVFDVRGLDWVDNKVGNITIYRP
jgi:hypothetical protein